MTISGLSDPAGEYSYEYCPSYTTPDEFEVVAEIEGEPGQVTFTMRGPVPKKGYSTLRRLREKKCPFDVQIKYATCGPMTDAENYVMQFIIEGARVTGYSVPELVARNPSSRALLEEEVTISAPAGALKQIFPLEWSRPTYSGFALGAISDVIICDDVSCGGDCGEGISDGCQQIFALQPRSNGFYVLYSTDGGSTWGEVYTGVTAFSTAMTKGACCGDRLYVIAYVNGDSQLMYATFDSIINEQPVWQTAYNFSGDSAVAIECIDDTTLVIATSGTSAYIYDTATGAMTQSVTGATFLHAIAVTPSGYVIVGGSNGNMAYSSDLSTWKDVDAYYIASDGVTETAAGNILSVYAASDTEWYAYDANRRYCTLNAGRTWTAQVTQSLADIGMGSRSVGIGVSGTKVYRTTTLWNSYKEQDVETATSLIAAATCENNPNFAVVVGSLGSGGFLSIGKVT